MAPCAVYPNAKGKVSALCDLGSPDPPGHRQVLGGDRAAEHLLLDMPLCGLNVLYCYLCVLMARLPSPEPRLPGYSSDPAAHKAEVCRSGTQLVRPADATQSCSHLLPAAAALPFFGVPFSLPRSLPTPHLAQSQLWGHYASSCLADSTSGTCWHLGT